MQFGHIVSTLCFVALGALGCVPETVPIEDSSDELGGDAGDGGEAGDGDACLGGEWIMDGPFPIDTHVGISQQLATIRGVELGDQVRIERSGGEQYAIFTVDEIRDLDAALDPSVIEMGETGRLRLGLAPDTPETCAHLVTKIAPMPPEFVEDAILASQQLVVLAPHGGQIEPGTDTQAHVLVEALSEHDPSLWACSGEHEGGGSFRVWHIPSTEISVDSFPLLADVATHDYDWAVSFHGMSPEGECVAAERAQLPDLDDPDALALILVGGLADPEVLEDVRSAILDAFDPSEFESEGEALVVLVPAAGPCAAKDLDNIVNRMSSALQTIQIESTPAARAHGRAERVALALAEVLAARMP